MEINLVAEGFRFMILGMSSVFLFLILMVWVLKIQGILLAKFFPQETKEPAASDVSVALPQDDANLVAAVSAAIFQHKQLKKGK